MRIAPKEALALLSHNWEKNQPQINFINNNPIKQIYQVGKTILILGTSDRDWVYLSSHDPGELSRATALLRPGDLNFALLEDWMLPIITKNRTIEWQMTSRKLVLPSYLSLPAPPHPTRPLTPAEAEYIHDHWPYAHVTTLEYTLDRISRGHSAAIWYEGNPVAWAITHDDGAIGFLYVLDQYRSQGYAQAVTLALIHRLRQEGQPAWVNIEVDNIKSLELVKKLGFVDSGLVHWLGLQPLNKQ